MLTEVTKRVYDNKFCVYGLVKDPTIEESLGKDENGKELILRRWVCLEVNNTFKEAKENEKKYKNK